MTFTFSINKFCSVALCLAIAISAGNGWAQILQQDEKADPPPTNAALEYPVGELEAMTLDQLNAELKQLTPDFRKSLKAMWTAKARYEHADKSESYGYGKTWREHAVEGQKAYQKVKELSLEIYLKTEKPTDEQFQLAFRMALASLDEGRVGIVHRVLQKMKKLRPDDEDVWVTAGRVAVFTNDYEDAVRVLEAKPKLIKELPWTEIALFDAVGGLGERWEKEIAIRQAEVESDDLPRVELTTSKGKIVIELFENEAPHTVGNFIHLIESGYYENAFFHQVIRHFRAQAGLFFKDRRPATDYEIVNESKANDARGIFRGTIATLPQGNTVGAAEFSIYTAPIPYASGDETVFGRVISGMDVADVLKVNSRFHQTGVSERVNSKEGDMPDDYIVSAKVLRKRPNVDYQPKKLATGKK